MENFNCFSSDTTKPCPDVQNTSSFLQVQTQDGDINYPNTQHVSSLSQSEMNFQTSVSQDTIPSEITSSFPIGVSSHSEESLQTQESVKNRKYLAKIARANRKVAMQMSSTNLSIQSSKRLRKKTSSRSTKSSHEDHNILYTPYNVKLRIVLKKMISFSDVEQGRIVLPKKEVEENLPGLATKEGVTIIMREVFSYTEWRMICRYWANHKGPMYIFDQCNEFVQKNMLEAGDQLNLYHDEQKNLYFTMNKKGKHIAKPNNISMTSETTEEEESTLRILMEELEHNDEEEPITLTSLYDTGGSMAERNYASH